MCSATLREAPVVVCLGAEGTEWVENRTAPAWRRSIELELRVESRTAPVWRRNTEPELRGRAALVRQCQRAKRLEGGVAGK